MSRLIIARGYSTSLVTVGPTKVKALKSILFTEGVPEVKIKQILNRIQSRDLNQGQPGGKLLLCHLSNHALAYVELITCTTLMSGHKSIVHIALDVLCVITQFSANFTLRNIIKMPFCFRVVLLRTKFHDQTNYFS